MFEDVAVQKHHYCGWCTKLLGDNDTCSNLACAGQSARSFLQIPLVPNCGEDYKVSSIFTLSIIITWCSYLKTLPVFIDPKLWSAIQQRHTSNGDGIKDIYDENLYTTLCGSGGFLSWSNPANLSLMMNTDGLHCFGLQPPHCGQYGLSSSTQLR